jgi:enamine deaminase RidA (YjgF/YER057c/UK114 family)
MERRQHHGVSPYEDAYGFSRAVRVGDVIYVSGTAPVPQPGSELAPDAHGQMIRCGAIAAEAIEALGGRIDDVVRTRMFIVDPADADDVGRAHRTVFGSAAPASTMVVVAGLLDPAWRVEIEVDVVVGAGREPDA